MDEDQKKRERMRRSPNNANQIQVEITQTKVQKLRQLKNNNESDFCNEVTKLLNDENNKKNYLENDEFKELVAQYLLPTDNYKGIGVQFNENDLDFPKKTTYRIGKVFKNCCIRDWVRRR